jgi:DNA ligase 1
MPEIADGEIVEIQGSGSKPYQLKNVGGVYSCSCPAWRNQSVKIEQRTCKHLRAYRGAEIENARIGSSETIEKVSSTPKKSGNGQESSTKAAPVLLAERWENDMNPTGWWMSEKLDGVRAYWDGSKFLSRQGNEYLAPQWFLEKLPNTPLDGELWLARKMFQQTVSIVRRQDRNDEWKKIKFVVFDAPQHPGPFEERTKWCMEYMNEHKPPYAFWHDHIICNGIEHLQTELARVEKLGGEGLMLRLAGSKYVEGRSSTLLKVKTFHDAEARVVDYVAGMGKYKGKIGGLLVELENGIRFSVGTGLSDAERDNPPPIGAIITYRYQEFSDKGVPRFPSYVGIRYDSDFKTKKINDLDD